MLSDLKRGVPSHAVEGWASGAHSSCPETLDLQHGAEASWEALEVTGCLHLPLSKWEASEDLDRTIEGS